MTQMYNNSFTSTNICKTFFVQFSFPIFADMKARDFLKNNRSVNASVIAEKMWPKNKSAKTYMSRKLNGERPWTDADEKKALDVLHELGIELTAL